MKQDRMCSSHVMSSLTLPVTASSFMSLLVLFSLSLLLLPCHCPCFPSLPPSPTTIYTSPSRPRSLFITSYPLHQFAVLHHVGLHHSILYTHTHTHTYLTYIHIYPYTIHTPSFRNVNLCIGIPGYIFPPPSQPELSFSF